MLCWPVPAGLTLAASYFGDLGDAGSWCALSLQYSEQYLICFYLPLLAAFTFNLVTYSCVLSHSRERRVSRITSLYLLGFAVVWLPSLICRTQVFLSPTHTLTLPPAALEALCMPLQGALNALVYGWSLPSIRDVYRTMLLGTDGLDALQITHEDRECSLGSLGSYSPPDHDAGLPSVLQPYPPPPGSLACLGGSVGSSGGGCGGAALPAGVSPLSAMGAVGEVLARRRTSPRWAARRPAVTWMQTARARAAAGRDPSMGETRARTQTVAAHLAPLVHLSACRAFARALGFRAPARRRAGAARRLANSR